jgi:serine/threonine protein kinase/Tol biopolymer transport system component
MTPDRYSHIGQLYHAASELDPSERAAFLERASGGDEELRQEVESLLSSHEVAPRFLASSALNVAAAMLSDEAADALKGKSIGRYRIVSLIGVGGMGRVYVAEDTELGRRVALKFLPEHFTHDKNQLQRFRQEARAASALNHPNILTVHEIGEADGTHYIATEYVEGETLRDRLHHSAISLREAIDVATQIADALATAHGAGIIHRDIKPDNVMLRRDGYVKVLDFGLAKLTGKDSEVAGPNSRASTRGIVRTDPGSIMGTVYYMSPEQVRGVEVDARADIWSLGVLLYELVAHHRPFEEETRADTIVSILQGETAAVLNDVSDIPAELKNILAKALRKNIEHRYQMAQEMATDLRQLRRKLDAGSQDFSLAATNAGKAPVINKINLSPATDGKVPPRATSSVEYFVSQITGQRRRVLLIGAGLLVLAVGIFYVWLKSRSTLVGPPFQTLRMTQATATGRTKLAAISRDGNYLAYAQEDNKQLSLWVKQVATGSSVQIVPPADVGYWGLTFSNDGNYVYYVKNDKSSGAYNKLYVVPSLGGTPKKLMEHVDSAIAFSANGQRFAFVRDFLKTEQTAIVVANADGGSEWTLATRKAPERFVSDFTTRIAWSPDDETIACPATNGSGASIAGVSVRDGSERTLTTQSWAYIGQVGWLSDGQGLVMIAAAEGSSQASSQLWFLSYPRGKARRITNDLNRYRDVTLVAGSQTLITVQTNRISNIWVAPREDPARARQITSGTLDSTVAWTPDGRIVYWSNANGSGNIWIMAADGSNQRQLTHEGRTGRPSVTADGRYIVFSATRENKTNIWRMDVDGTDLLQLTDSRLNVNPCPSPDGRWVIYVSQDRFNGTLWRVPMDGGKPTQLSGPTVNLPVVSPDGKQIACFYWDEQATPPRGVMVLPFEGGKATKRFNILSPGPEAFVLHWTPEGDALLYIDPHLANIWRQPISGGEPTPVTDFQGDQIFNFAYSPDGKFLATARGRITEDVVLIENSN